MVVTMGQKYNAGEKPTVIMYTYINRHEGPATKQNKTKHNVLPGTSLGSKRVVILYIR